MHLGLGSYGCRHAESEEEGVLPFQTKAKSIEENVRGKRITLGVRLVSWLC